MSKDRNFITYHAPKELPEAYATKALHILQDLEHEAPQALAIFLAANSVLTLSGVRAYDAYHEFYDFIAPDEQLKALSVLRRHGVDVYFSDALLTQKHESSVVFELMNYNGFEKMFDMYTLPKNRWWPIDVPTAFVSGALEFLAWSYIVEHNLQNMMDDEVLPKQWLHSGTAAHDIRFGMLLGYPAQAIESNAREMAAYADGLEGPRHQDARIAHQDAYYAAWPVYSYAPELANSPEITAHEKLWSDILSLVYDSDWHKRLESNKIVTDSLAQIKK